MANYNVGNIEVGKDVNLKTTVKSNAGVKHFVHVIGDNDIKGNYNEHEVILCRIYVILCHPQQQTTLWNTFVSFMKQI